MEFCVLFVCVECALVCGIKCYIFRRVEQTLILWNVVLYFSDCGTYSCIVDFLLYLSAFGTRYGIMECCAIFIRMWNVLLYCEILCYIFLRMERALVLWKLLLYLSSCGTRCGIVEFCVLFFHIVKNLVEKSILSLYLCVVFLCCCF